MTDKQKAVLITGASSGIGYATAQLFQKKGWNVVATMRNPDDAKGLASLPGVLVLRLDVNDRDSIYSAVQEAIKEFGAIDVLVNNAGVRQDTLMMSMTDEQWEGVMDTSMNGMYYVTKQVLNNMLMNRYGRIINMVSVSGLKGQPGQVNYSAAKAGVVAMTESWAKELSRYNIRTGAIAPGTINTDMIAAMKPEARDRLIGAVPLKRLGEPDNIAKAATFIFENDYFTGRVVEVDGGLR